MNQNTILKAWDVLITVISVVGAVIGVIALVSGVLSEVGIDALYGIGILLSSAFVFLFGFVLSNTLSNTIDNRDKLKQMHKQLSEIANKDKPTHFLDRD